MLTTRTPRRTKANKRVGVLKPDNLHLKFYSEQNDQHLFPIYLTLTVILPP